jgi:crotonobetainyl-CoA:carnitine CoA-transferase CaiB-like acyl-CoA transferase
MTTFAGDVPAAPVLDIAQALDNPFVAEREGIRSYSGSPHGRDIRMLASPIRVPGEDLPARAAPTLGEHTEAVLRGLGLSEPTIAELKAKRLI